MKRMLLMLAAATLVGCSGASAPPPAHPPTPPHPSVRVDLRVVDPDGPVVVQWKGERLALRAPALATRADIVDVSVDPGAGYPGINFTFSPAAGERLGRATPDLLMKKVALTVNDQVLTVATVSGPFADALQVRGMDASEAQVRAVARYITEGGPPAALP